MYVNLPVVPKEDGAEAGSVGAAVPLLADVAFADGSPVDATDFFAEGSPVDAMVVVLPETLVETAVPMVPDG